MRILQNNDLSVTFRVTDLVRFAPKWFMVVAGKPSVWTDITREALSSSVT